MRARTVTAPNGRVWQVSYRWLHRPPRWRGWGFRSEPVERPRDEDDDDLPGAFRALDFLPAPDSATGCLIVLALAAALLLGWFVVLPFLALVFDVAFVLALAMIAIGARVLLRRPWIIEAEEKDRVSERREWLVLGWRESGNAIAEVAGALESGIPLERISPSNQVTPR